MKKAKTVKTNDSGTAKKITIYDLAKYTGFSPGTVSRVLNNRDRVKSETRETILKAAKELDLKPQASVRSRQIAILTDPRFSDRVEGYAATLSAHLSFALSRKKMGIVLPTDPFEELPGLFLDGIVVVTYDTKLLEFLKEFEKRIPIVYMDKFEVSERQYCIFSDHYNSGYLAAKYFIEHGKKKLACFGGEGPGFEQRLLGYRKAIEEAGLEYENRMMASASSGRDSAAVTRIVRGGADCIYVPGTSLQAMECIHLLTYVMGLRVPEDIAVIGGENEGISELINPPLTAIEEPLGEMAETAAEMLDNLTSGKKVSQRAVKMPVRLIERNSV
ncbi:LacI family DNA-binding transcriptional regulator [Pelagicoccus sp. SDUM812003]|uniref:LacI family DNA-binding transcriptional regulator n=1 Tax=Pelagicoccus sp. SDUM812003 TaxID=3041267 RepID=UPI00280E4283|nr:LacI family DNA-binding transcriptional regulator [Pelagicoccus sp. SDUM812003]MDQ8205019.1 LacI family DNA-binding transcriptional regulator [Pelagicoccus sp. SDUM812003]